MSKKSSDKEFGANPFKSLKGFVVSDADKKSKTPKGKVTKPSTTTPEPSTASDDLDFTAEMEHLGVTPTEQDKHIVREAPPAAERSAGPAARPKTDEEHFLAALGEMDVCFRDELPVEETEEPTGAKARRIKQLRQGKIVPDAQLDLHGVTRHQVHDKVRFFLEDCVYQGIGAAVIVTGRGNHSQGEPVLRSEVERFLRLQGKTWVVEWDRAPRQYGGEGALVVFLRKKPQP